MAVEIIALIFAIAVIVKLIFFLAAPKAMMKWVKYVTKSAYVLTVVYLVALVVVGYFVFAEMSVIQVVAGGMFILPLFALTMAAYPKMFETLVSEMMKNLKKSWLPWLLWVALALWVLYALFM